MSQLASPDRAWLLRETASQAACPWDVSGLLREDAPSTLVQNLSWWGYEVFSLSSARRGEGVVFRSHLPAEPRPAGERSAQKVLSLPQEALSAPPACCVGKREGFWHRPE